MYADHRPQSKGRFTTRTSGPSLTGIGRLPPDGQVSSAFMRSDNRQVWFYPIIGDFRCNSITLARFESNEAIACHRIQRSRQIRLWPPSQLRQFLDGTR
jgi:hypothetical protein